MWKNQPQRKRIFFFSFLSRPKKKRKKGQSRIQLLLFPHMTVRWDYHFLSGIIAIITALRRRQKVVQTWLQIGLSLFLSLIEIYRVGASSQTVRTCFEFVCTCVRACVRVSYVVQVFFGRTHMLHSLKFSALIFPSSLSLIPKRLDVISFCMPRKYIVACSDWLRGEEKEKGGFNVVRKVNFNLFFLLTNGLFDTEYENWFSAACLYHVNQEMRSRKYFFSVIDIDARAVCAEDRNIIFSFLCVKARKIA